MRLACVVHRFGPDIAGGSEAHCRAVAAQLAVRHDVTILTTCARDHVSWKNEHPAGMSQDGRLSVHRFAVSRARSLNRFKEISELAFGGRATPADEEQWFVENGPQTPALVDHVRAHAVEYDLMLFWSFRYYQSFFGLPAAGPRAVLVPTAEDDPVLSFASVGQLFTRPAGFIFLTPEEEALVARHCPQPLATSCVIGTGLEPAGASAPVNLDRHGLRTPFLLYLGRVDPNKGCETLLRHFMRWQDHTAQRITLALAGPANMPIPEHPSIRFLGYVDEPTRDALLSTAAALIVPSPYESLSIVLLEAWNRGTPAIVNGGCEVLRGQAKRSDGALYYRTYDEFARAVGYLLGNPEVARRLGENGRAYVEREYRWPTVMQKLETFLTGLQENATTKTRKLEE